jgi:FkbM family methyltransferase
MNKALENATTLLRTPGMWYPWLRWSCYRAMEYAPSVNLSWNTQLRGFGTFSAFWAAHAMRPTRRERRFIQRFVQPNSLVLDIGANCGAFCIVMAKMQPSAAIHAFEPSPRTFRQLLANVRFNNVDGTILCHECALSTVIGSMKFSADPASSGTNHLLPAGAVDFQNVVEVKTISLDEFTNDFSRSVAFAKIDVECFECAVLRGAKRTLQARKLEAGMIELCPENLRSAGASVEELLETVDEVGWRLCWITPAGDVGQGVTLDAAKNTVLENVALVPGRQ